MRIVAGEFRRRYLRVPKGSHVRPTTDRVKESVFAILRQDLPGARILDLFAGCGNLGIEALSRGAEHATFVDASTSCVQIIKENLTALGVDRARARIIRGDARDMLREFAERGECFNLVFVDPPYESNLVHEVLRILGTSGLTSAEGVVVVEHPQQSPPADFYGVLTRMRVQNYGRAVVSFYRQVVPAHGISTATPRSAEA